MFFHELWTSDFRKKFRRGLSEEALYVTYLVCDIGQGCQSSVFSLGSGCWSRSLLLIKHLALVSSLPSPAFHRHILWFPIFCVSRISSWLCCFRFLFFLFDGYPAQYGLIAFKCAPYLHILDVPLHKLLYRLLMLKYLARILLLYIMHSAIVRFAGLSRLSPTLALSARISWSYFIPTGLLHIFASLFTSAFWSCSLVRFFCSFSFARASCSCLLLASCARAPSSISSLPPLCCFCYNYHFLFLPGLALYCPICFPNLWHNLCFFVSFVHLPSRQIIY